jgi:ADP-ribose pyrophosphatase YjhB (NUDIX family)
MTQALRDGDELIAVHDGDAWVPETGPQAHLIEKWFDEGVPALRGVEQDGVITEMHTICPPDDPFFGLALLDQFDREGWTITDDKMTQNVFCKTGEGGGQDPHCSKHGFNENADHHAVGPGWQNVPADWKKRSYGGVVVNDKGEYLLREPDKHFDGYHWTFPKGRIDTPHENPAHTALREVQEETGHMGEITGYVPGGYKGGSYVLTKEEQAKPDAMPTSSITHYFLMKTKGSTGKIQWETAGIHWASYEEAQRMISRTTNPGGRARDLAVLDAAHKALGHETSPPPPLPEPQPKPTPKVLGHDVTAPWDDEDSSAVKFVKWESQQPKKPKKHGKGNSIDNEASLFGDD